jgi:hypothetical protein
MEHFYNPINFVGLNIVSLLFSRQEVFENFFPKAKISL